MKRLGVFALFLAGSLLFSSSAWAQEPEPLREIAIEFHVIGFAVDATTTQQLQQIAAVTGGQYYDARDQQGLETAFGQGLGVVPAGAATVEVEPNDRFDQANLIAASGSVAGTINPARDGDWYRLQVRQRGELHVLITEVAPDLDIVFQVWDANKDVWWSWVSPLRAGGDTEALVDLPGPGDYWLEVRDGGDNAASAQPYRLQTVFEPAVDTGEPNDSFGQATPMIPGQPMLSTILPRRDVDWYRLKLASRGELWVSITEVAPDLDIVFRVWDANRDVWWNWISPLRAGGDTEAVVDIPGPGDYWIEVRDGSDDARSVQPYRLEATFTPAVDSGEPNDSFGAATPLKLDQTIQGTILPRRDSDWYRFEVLGRSQLHVLVNDVPAELDVVFRVWDANREVLWNWVSPARAGGDTEALVDLPAAGEYTLEVRDGNDDARSIAPYTLRTALALAADPVSANDTFGTAQLIYLGTEVQGSILPRRDHDWYKVQIPTQASANVAITGSPDNLNLAFRVWNANKDVVLNWQGAARGGGDISAMAAIAEPGFYFVEVADGSDDASSPAPYTLLVTLEAEP